MAFVDHNMLGVDDAYAEFFILEEVAHKIFGIDEEAGGGTATLNLFIKGLSNSHLQPMVPSPTGFSAPRMVVWGPSRLLSLEVGRGPPWRYNVAVRGIHDIIRY
ncbi:hypothetical protein ACFE04_016595 [Oxalis oulophora]